MVGSVHGRMIFEKFKVENYDYKCISSATFFNFINLVLTVESSIEEIAFGIIL